MDRRHHVAQEPVMRATKTIAAEIAAVEGFDARFVSRDGSDITLRRVDGYDYSVLLSRRSSAPQWSTR
jgi:hypothetical protein